MTAENQKETQSGW